MEIRMLYTHSLPLFQDKMKAKIDPVKLLFISFLKSLNKDTVNCVRWLFFTFVL
jgi:hypothetical protein